MWGLPVNLGPVTVLPSAAGLADGTTAWVGATQYVVSGGAWVAVSLIRRLNRPIRVAFFGPSTADNGGPTDMLSIYSSYPGSGQTVYQPVPAGKFEGSIASDLVPVICGGVSGETIQASYNRFKSAYSATRKSAQDVISLRPDVVVYRSCGINTIQTYSAIASDIEIATQTQIEIEIAKFFVRNGVPVIFSGPLGYSAAVAQNLLDCRRDAVVRYNNAFRKSIPAIGASFVAPLGNSMDSAGAFLSGLSNDGIHFNQKGGRVFGAVEQAAIRQYYYGRENFGPQLFDGPKALGNNDGTLAVTHGGGNSEGTITWTAEEVTIPINAAAGGTTTMAFLSAALTNCFSANTPYVVSYDFTLYDQSGNMMDFDDSISVLFRCLFRSGGSTNDSVFDTTINYKNERLNLPVCVPAAGAPTLVQCFAQLQTSTSKTLTAKLRPIQVFAASAIW